MNTRRDQPNGLAAALGCELTAAGTIVTDPDGRTSVAGVYAAGDAATAHSRTNGWRRSVASPSYTACPTAK